MKQVILKYAAVVLLSPALVYAEQDQAVDPTEQDHKTEQEISEILQLMQKLTHAEQEKIQLVDLLKTAEGQKDQLRDQVQDLAKEVFELRQLIGDLKTKLPPPTQSANAADTPVIAALAGDAFPKPDRSIKGNIMAVSAEARFAILDIGGGDGVKEGYRFKVLRGGKLVAVVKIVKLLESHYSRAEPVTGYKIEDMQDYDQVESVSSMPEPVSPVRQEQGQVPAATNDTHTADSAVRGAPTTKETAAYRIQGKIGDKYTTNLGRPSRIKKGDRIGVVRSQKIIAMLEIDEVGDESSTAVVAEKLSAEEILDGDALSLGAAADPARSGARTSGVIKDFRRNAVTKKIEKILINIGFDDGASKGQTYMVRCNGQPAGKLQITEVYKPYSFTVPGSETREEDLHIGDTVELVK